MKLGREYVEKPWGRTVLPAIFDPPANACVGEVWYTGPSTLPLLAKYIFTSEALSIQVHPNDDQARARGLASGKAECWYILDAEPDAVLGLGLTRRVTDLELRSAALDGSIEQLIDWRPVRRGDFIFVPPGTIHAIGAGITLLEFQQNADITYRLYDYGRPRELHLDDGVTVATKDRFDRRLMREVPEGASLTLVRWSAFTLVSGTADVSVDQQRWIMPITGAIRSNGEVTKAGDIFVAEPGVPVIYEDAWALTGTTG